MAAPTPFSLYPAVAFARKGDGVTLVGADEATRKHALANDTLYVRARGAELLLTLHGAFYTIANTFHVRGHNAIEHLARHGLRAIAETAARHPRMRATLEDDPSGLPSGTYFVISPRLSPAVLSNMFVVVSPTASDGLRHWERVVHERINTLSYALGTGADATSLRACSFSAGRFQGRTRLRVASTRYPDSQRPRSDPLPVT